jgi:hypothetical protein
MGLKLIFKRDPKATIPTLRDEEGILSAKEVETLEKEIRDKADEYYMKASQKPGREEVDLGLFSFETNLRALGPYPQLRVRALRAGADPRMPTLIFESPTPAYPPGLATPRPPDELDSANRGHEPTQATDILLEELRQLAGAASLSNEQATSLRYAIDELEALARRGDPPISVLLLAAHLACSERLANRTDARRGTFYSYAAEGLQGLRGGAGRSRDEFVLHQRGADGTTPLAELVWLELRDGTLPDPRS